MEKYDILTAKYCIFDMETDGLYNDVTKMHCLSYQIYHNKGVTERRTIYTKEEICKLFNEEYVFVGHNIIRYDFPVIAKLFNIDRPKNFIDTLGLSYYLFNQEKVHGLEYWGNKLGVKKPFVEDWKELNLEVYVNRCQFDTEINLHLFRYLLNYVAGLYDYKQDSILHIIEYLNFKLDCIYEQEVNGIPLDINKCKETLQKVYKEYNIKYRILQNAMPKHLGKVYKKKPLKYLKANGEVSKKGQEWLDFLKEHNLPECDYVREAPNPQSVEQIKEWLFSLGWEPITFKDSSKKSKKKEKVPQISLPFGGGICPSVKELYEKAPDLEAIEGLYMLKHRIGILEGFLECVDEEGKIYASAQGFTNTMRLRHKKPFVNLPKPSVPWGKEIRGCMYVDDKENYIMCGTDVSSLEDNTKQHYIYFYDPEYVREMRVPGFDPHLDIAKLAGFVTDEEIKFYKKIDSLSDKSQVSEEDMKEYKRIKKLRAKGKSTNFAATYKAGAAKIAEVSKLSLEGGQELHNTYWDRNKAIKDVEENSVIKTITFDYPIIVKNIVGINDDGSKIIEEEVRFVKRTQKWLLNPVSNIYIFIKDEKDIFSSLNQSTGVYVFDTWLKKARVKLHKIQIPVLMQYHDEFMFILKNMYKDSCEKILDDAMKEVNNTLKLNVEITNSVDFGYNYSETH